MTELARSPAQLGNIIRRTRKKLGLTQAELGDASGLRQETISLIEGGNSSARLETVLSVLAALDLEIQIAPRTRHSIKDIEDIL